jgi:hypothetical protein
MRVGAQVGAVVGTGLDELGANGYAFVPTGPGLVFISGSSNGQGIGVAANMTDFPGIATAFPSFQLARSGASLSADPTWVNEAKQDLQPRTQNISGYAVGTCGGELQMGRVLDAANPGLWGCSTFTLDGALLHTTGHFLKPTFPTTPPQWVLRLYAAIDAAVVAHAKPLKAFVWMHGNDANDGPSALAYFTNLTYLMDQIRLRYGDIAIIVERITDKNTAGAVQLVRSAMDSFVMANDRARGVYSDELGMRDTAHYADDAGGVLGYCELGNRMAAAVLSGVNRTRDLTAPFWGAHGNPVIAGSGAFPSAIPFPYVYGTFNGKADFALLALTGSGVNSYATPSGWTLPTNGIQYANTVAADARLQVWIKPLAPGETAPTIADVVSDDAKAAVIVVIRNSTGLDVNPTGSTVSTAAATTAVSFPSITTVTDNCLIVNVLAHRTDVSPPQTSGGTNASLTGLQEHFDFCTTQGLGYGLTVFTGKLATHGASGSTTATLQLSVSQALITLAFKP